MSLLDLLGIVQVLWNGVAVNPTRKRINIIGGAVGDNPALDATDITLPAGGGGGEGTVSGPATSVAGNIATFANTDGTEIDDSGVALSSLATDAELAGAITAALEGRDLGTDGAKLDGIEAGAQVTSAARVLTALAAAAGDVSVNSQKITSLANPTNPQDADTKAARDAAIAAAAVGWVTALDVNFTQEPNQTFSNGANTFKGLTWTGENIAAKTSQFAIVNGTGLVVDCNAANSLDYPINTASDAPQIAINLQDLIPDFVLGRTVTRVSAELDSTSGANFEYAYVTIGKVYSSWSANVAFHALLAKFCDNSPDLGSLTTVRRMCAFLFGGSRTSVIYAATRNVQAMEVSLTGIRSYSATISAVNTDPNSNLFARTLLSLDGWSERSTDLTNTTGTVNNFMVPTTVNLTGSNRDLRLALGCFTGNTSNTLVGTFKRLRVEYRH